MRYVNTETGVRDWLDEGAPTPAILSGVDLVADDLSTVSLAGCTLLGCRLDGQVAEQAHRQGAMRIDELGLLPPALRMFRSSVYTVPELFAGMAADGANWEGTPDYAGYDFFMHEKKPRALDPARMAAARLHDTTQEHLVQDLLRNRRVIAIMGGHDYKRQAAAGQRDIYWECVDLAKTLTESDFFVLTGGGPGLMEAGNLGALLAHRSVDEVAHVKRLLADHKYSSPEWRATARQVREHLLGAWDAEVPERNWSLGIPTWFYGHEPPNLFASHHSKMFYNSLREDGLVSLARAGIIFFRGNGGTVQEIFQDACQNYYPLPGEKPTPMIFYNDEGYWSRNPADLSWPTDDPADRRKPVLPLVRQLAVEKKFTDAIFVTDSTIKAAEFIKRANPATGTPLRKADFRLAPVDDPTAPQG